MWAILEAIDFCLIALIVMFLSGGVATATAALRPRDKKRLRQIEDKIDLLLAHHHLHYDPPADEPWQQIADDPKRKIEAIAAYRKQYGVGLAEAKQAVEDYLNNK